MLRFQATSVFATLIKQQWEISQHRAFMHVMVGIKRVVDFASKVRVNKDMTWIETEGVKHSINPFDEIAVEEAIRLKEKQHASKITVVTCGPSKSIDVIRTALAMGADRGIHIETDTERLEPFHVATLLKEICMKEKPDIVLLGKQAIDDDSNQTGQLLAGMLDWAQGTFLSKLQFDPDTKKLTVTREVDGGLCTIEIGLPAILTTDLRLNEPRYASLQNIMKAKQKPIEKISASSLVNPDKLTRHQEIISVIEPEKRKGGKMVESVDELIQLLKEEAKVLPQ